MNPYYSYAIAFSISIAVYNLGWSDYFPPLSFQLLLFMMLSILLCIITGRLFQARVKIEYIKLSGHSLLLSTTLVIYLLWIVEFIHAGGIPIVLILLGENYDYRLFGVPTLHVLIVTFSSFITTYAFHFYLSTRKKSYLLFFIINLSAAILIMNRGMLLMNVSSCLFVYLLSLSRFKVAALLKTAIVAFSLITLFGILGHIRVSHLLNKFYDRTIVYEIGQATEQFQTNAIPSEYFWTYLYIAQPLGTLQHNIDNPQDRDLDIPALLNFINSELVPDFISKRIYGLLNMERKSPLLIADHLNASMVYSRSYAYLGWTGMFIMLAFTLFFAYGYFLLISKHNPFYITGIATMCTLYMFLSFDNLFVFSGFSFQLIYPIFFGWMHKKRILKL